MLRILHWLWTGDWHLHKWEIHQISEFYITEASKLPFREDYILKCTYCGDIKIVKGTKA